MEPPALLTVLDEMTVYALLSTVMVPVFIGTILYSRLPNYGRGVVLYFYLAMVTEIFAYVQAVTNGNNIIVYYYFVSFSALVLGGIYSKYLRRTFIYQFLIVPIVAMVEAAYMGTDKFNSYSFTVLNIIVLVVALYTFYKMLIHDVDTSMFYFNSVLIFYTVSSTVVFFTANYLQENNLAMMTQLFGIHAYINAFTNLAFGASIWTLYKSWSTVP